MADYFYAVDLSRNEEFARTPAMLTSFSSSWFAKTTAPRITMSLTASIQHLKLRSKPQNSVTAWREQKTSVTSEQIDMAAGSPSLKNFSCRIWMPPITSRYWLIQNDPDAQKIVRKAFEHAVQGVREASRCAKMSTGVCTERRPRLDPATKPAR
jgi:hypothetical protein